MSDFAMHGARWMAPEAAHDVDDPVFVRDRGEAVEALTGLRVVAPDAKPDRVEAMLEAGVGEVLVGDSALLDGTLVKRLAQRFEKRVGIWLPVQRAEARWGLDRESNADFSFVAAACPVPRWLVRHGDGMLTDVDAVWWATQMVDHGASRVLVAVFAPDDDDLSVCAEMAAAVGDQFWLSTGTDDLDELRFWVQYGQARNLVLPEATDPPALLAALHSRLDHEEAVA